MAWTAEDRRKYAPAVQEIARQGMLVRLAALIDRIDPLSRVGRPRLWSTLIMLRALWHLARPLSKAGVRLLALEPEDFGAEIARRYAHRIPFIVKMNHSELLSYPNAYDQVFYVSVQEAADLALKADPKNPSAHILLGNALAGLNDTGRAVKQMEQAIALDPSFAAVAGFHRLRRRSRRSPPR